MLGRHIPDVVMQGPDGRHVPQPRWVRGLLGPQCVVQLRQAGLPVGHVRPATERGHELFLELVTKADVFLENNAAGVVEHLGIGWEVLHAANPRLVMVRFPGFGITGPYAHHKGYGTNMEAVAGHTDGPRLRRQRPVHHACLTAWRPQRRQHAAWAVQAALLARERTGEGQLVEISQSEAVLHHIAYDVLDYEFNGRERGQRGNDHPAFAPYGVFPVRGRGPVDRDRLHLGCGVRRAGATTGSAGLADDERFATAIARLRNRKAVNELVAERTRHYVAEDARRSGCRAAVSPPPRWRTSRRCTPTST